MNAARAERVTLMMRWRHSSCMSLSPEIGLRRPEYTGSDRCWPCTVVNVVLVAAGAAAAALAGWPGVGAGLGIAGLALVWLRGYVVPGTPRFAPRLVAPIPGSDALFHGTDGGGAATPDGGTGSLDPAEIGGEELLDRLVGSGVLEVDGDGRRHVGPGRERLRLPPLAGVLDVLLHLFEQSLEFPERVA